MMEKQGPLDPRHTPHDAHEKLGADVSGQEAAERLDGDLSGRLVDSVRRVAATRRPLEAPRS